MSGQVVDDRLVRQRQALGEAQAARQERLIQGRAVHLSASMMCSRLGSLTAEIRRLEHAGIDSFHFDVMDGHFVPNLGFSSDVLRSLRAATALPFHVHAMVDNPEAYLDQMAAAGCDTYVFHLEATRYPRRMVERVHAAGLKCGIAINPGTPLDYLGDGNGADLVLIMGVEPGFASQRWFLASPQRVGAVRDRVARETELGLDGHVDSETGPMAEKAGATLFVCGTSGLFQQPSGYATNVLRLRASLTAQGRGVAVPPADGSRQ